MANKKNKRKALDDDDHDIERLKAELQQELQMKEMLEQSTSELRFTVSELEKRYDGVSEEGNEWKIRYETQQELNLQLENQLAMLKNKVQGAKENALEERNNHMRTYDDLNESGLKKLFRTLEKDRGGLENQLKDFEWRMDQESKAFHKANEQRKAIMTELSHLTKEEHDARYTIEEQRVRQAQAQADAMMSLTPRDSKNSSQTSFRTPGDNVPDHQRILDPRHGPIKKTAAVKKLPKL